MATPGTLSLEQLIDIGPGDDQDMAAFSKATGATPQDVMGWVQAQRSIPRFDGEFGKWTNALRGFLGQPIKHVPLTPDLIANFAEAVRKLPSFSQVSDATVQRFGEETGDPLTVGLTSFNFFKQWMVSKALAPAGVTQPPPVIPGGTGGPAPAPTAAPPGTGTPAASDVTPAHRTVGDWVQEHQTLLLVGGGAALVFHMAFAPKGRR